MRRAALALVGALCCAAALAVVPAPGSANPPPPTIADAGLHVVVLRGQPAAVFTGRPGVAATAPAAGQRFRPGRVAALAYDAVLAARQRRVLARVGGADVVYSYRTALNGFAARLTADQVKALRADPAVVRVERTQTLRLDHAGAAAGGGPPGAGSALDPAWRALGGPGGAGRGTVIGIVDTGVWPDNPSFAGLPLDERALRGRYPGFTGTCQTGERWAASTCSSKVVAARYFVDGFGADQLSSAELLSPRDAIGHGSHVAATAAGNDGVDVTIAGQEFGRVSGVAPAAALAVYKACWAAPDPADDGCDTADTIAAVDQAVRDGVDVLNLSAESPAASGPSALDLAFLGAASAGVFVTTPAGNGGPAPGTVAQAPPWVTTVGASERTAYRGTLLLGDGTRLRGAMVSDRAVRSAPLVDARSAAVDGRRAAARCEPGALDATAVTGAIVVCRRGLTARVSKSEAVEQAGGAGMVLVNETPGSTDTDVHAVPTVHLRAADERAIGDYLADAARPTASLLPGARPTRTPPRLAPFSGRGPVAGSADLLKPDVVAPGASVVAAVAPPADGGRLWDLASGTSMAAARVAGIGALIRSAHPGWTPALVKSAIMTTAGPLTPDPGPSARGAGEARVGRALDPGLGFPAGKPGWLASVRGSDPSLRDLWGTAKAADLNQASIAVGSLVGTRTLTRRVTNLGDQAETYVARVRGLRGIAARVTPPVLRLDPAETARFRVTLTAQRAADYGAVATGALRLAGTGGHLAVVPIVARPETFAAPAEVVGTGSAGSVTVRGTAGLTGRLRAAPAGFAAAAPEEVELTAGPFESAHPEDSDALTRAVAVPTGTVAVRFELDAAADADLYAYREGRLVAAATSPAARETLTLDAPRPGVYDVVAVAPAPPGAAGEPVGAALTAWVVPPSTPEAIEVERRLGVTGGRPAAVEVAWRGLPPGHRWFGVVRYPGTREVTHLTLG